MKTEREGTVGKELGNAAEVAGSEAAWERLEEGGRKSKKWVLAQLLSIPRLVTQPGGHQAPQHPVLPLSGNSTSKGAVRISKL